MRRLTSHTTGIPEDLPDRLRHWTVEVNPESDPQNRRLQAYMSFVVYARELTDFLRRSGTTSSVHRVQRALGTTLTDFWAVADAAGKDNND